MRAHPHHPNLVLQPPSHRWYSACPRHHHHHLQLQNVHVDSKSHWRVWCTKPPTSLPPPQVNIHEEDIELIGRGAMNFFSLTLYPNVLKRYPQS